MASVQDCVTRRELLVEEAIEQSLELETSMDEFVKQVLEIQAPFNMIIVVVFLGVFGGVIGTIAKEVRKFATHRSDLEIKRELLDRGMSADEIDEVLQAGQARSKNG